MLLGENYSLTSTNYATCWKAEHIYTPIFYDIIIDGGIPDIYTYNRF
jgi:hypothetical protein